MNEPLALFTSSQQHDVTADLRHQERVLRVRQNLGELELVKLGARRRRTELAIDIGHQLYLDWLDRASPGHGDFVAGIADFGLTVSTGYRYLRLYFLHSGAWPPSFRPPSFSFEKDEAKTQSEMGTENAESFVTSELPPDIFIPVAQVTTDGLRELQKKREEAARFPEKPTRVQLPECTENDKKRFEDSLEILRDNKDDVDIFQLALTALEFHTRLIRGGLFTTLHNIRQREPRFRQMEDCELVLDCVNRVAVQLGELYAPKDPQAAA